MRVPLVLGYYSFSFSREMEQWVISHGCLVPVATPLRKHYSRCKNNTPKLEHFPLIDRLIHCFFTCVLTRMQWERCQHMTCRNSPGLSVSSPTTGSKTCSNRSGNKARTEPDTTSVASSGQKKIRSTGMTREPALSVSNAIHVGSHVVLCVSMVVLLSFCEMAVTLFFLIVSLFFCERWIMTYLQRRPLKNTSMCWRGRGDLPLTSTV